MSSATRKLKFRDIAPRTLADYAIIHCAMLLAFSISAVYQTRGAFLVSPEDVVGPFRHYYFSGFLALSPLFPIIFYLNGIYTHVRFYTWWKKLNRVVLAVLTSLAAFITANFFLLPLRNPVGRSAALIFVPLAIFGLVGVRVAKEWLIGREREEQIIKTRAIDQGPVLVIGGAGYIGCWLVRRLLEEGQRVRVLDNAVYGLEPIRALLANPRLDYQNGDCRNIQDVVKAMRGVSSVVHLAAIVGDPACEIDHTATIEINYAATRMLVEIAKGYGVERFLFASSCSVYGASGEFMTEASPVKPVSLYGETKVASERVLMEAADDLFHPVLLRFATVFGLSNRPRFDLVVNLLTAKACQDGVITIYNGEQWRPFVHVKDLAEAMILILNAPLCDVSRQVFNVGDNRLNLRLSEMAATIKHVIPETIVESVENSDRRNYRVIFDKIEKCLGFQCRYTLEDGVREIKTAFDSSDIINYKNLKFSNLGFLMATGAPENKKVIDREIMAAFGGEHIRQLREQTQILNSKVQAAASS
jgi:nucleoside-diphosphate-sugar epimerase